MTDFGLSRRSAVALLSALPDGLITRRASAQAIMTLAERAAAEDPAVWYESSRPDQGDQLIAAFTKAYPKVKVRHESIPGGNGVAARVTQESMAGARTADIVTVGGGETTQLLKANLIAQQDYEAYGVDPKLVFDKRAVHTAVTVYCIVYNKTLVKKKPTGWDDLLDSQYKGEVGTWVRAAALAELSRAWGEEKVMAYYNKLLAQEPMFFNSAAPLAQSVAAGEIALGLGSYHNSLPPMKKGAPIDIIPLDPTPMSSVFSFVASKARSPATAALFVSWLCSPAGNVAYEDATDRGSPLISATKTTKFVAGLPTTEWPLDNKEPYAAIFEKMNRMVASVTVK